MGREVLRLDEAVAAILPGTARRSNAMGAPLRAVRRMLQPGKPRPDRVTGALAPRPRRALVWLKEGRSLHDSLTAAFARFGVRAGAFQLLGGDLAAAAYHVAVPKEDSIRAVEYGPPITLAPGTRIVRATGSFGEDLSGAPLLHIHGVLAEADGRAHGGHISPNLCVVGAGGVRAILLLTVGFKQVIDRETRFSLFFPFSEITSHAPIHHPADQHWARGERAPRP
jgi:predicted DNA-binding protein with PD1-like motif